MTYQIFIIKGQSSDDDDTVMFSATPRSTIYGHADVPALFVPTVYDEMPYTGETGGWARKDSIREQFSQEEWVAAVPWSDYWRMGGGAPLRFDETVRRAVELMNGLHDKFKTVIPELALALAAADMESMVGHTGVNFHAGTEPREIEDYRQERIDGTDAWLVWGPGKSTVSLSLPVAWRK